MSAIVKEEREKWEYDILTCGSLDNVYFLKCANKLGEKGWEVFSATSDTFRGLTFVFKRRILPE